MIQLLLLFFFGKKIFRSRTLDEMARKRIAASRKGARQ